MSVLPHPNDMRGCICVARCRRLVRRGFGRRPTWLCAVLRCFAGGLQAPFFLCNYKLLATFMECDDNLKRTVLDLAEPLVQAQGLVVWGLEIVPGPSTRVCLYVADSEGNASINNCEDISRQLGLALEVEDCFPGRYVLEVSSPGLERKFFTLEQLARYVGDIVDVRLRAPLDEGNRKVWRGRLLSTGADCLEIEPCSVSPEGVITPDNAPVVVLPWQNVAHCRRVHVFVTPQKPGKKVGAGKKPR